jgi:hypothetical protein
MLKGADDLHTLLSAIHSSLRDDRPHHIRRDALYPR